MTADFDNRRMSDDRPSTAAPLRFSWIVQGLKYLLTLIGCVLLVMLAANAWVVGATRGLIFDDISRLSVHDVGVVLGTSPYTRYGNPNLLFSHRMKAAAELYAAGRVHHILVSGSNPDQTYNEPRKMYQALRRLGVPDAALTMDFAGFRTLDSIVRAQRIFGLNSYVVISQRYHDYRALFIARYYGIDAVAYIRPEEDRRQPLRTEAREYLARVKAVVDLFALSTRPRFLGPERPIEVQPEQIEPFDFLLRYGILDDGNSPPGEHASEKEAHPEPSVPALLRRLPPTDGERSDR